MAFTKVTGTLVDIGDLDLTNVGQIQLDSIAGDADANTSITFSGSDVITIATGGSGRLTIGDGALSPVTDNQIDLGTSSLEFKDAFFDGTVTSDAFAGPLTGDVTGNVSGTAATVTTAAQTNITSLGTLTGLTVNGATVFNENSADVDFRVESNGEANMLFVNGGDNTVLIGSNTSVANTAGTGALQVLGTGGGDTTLTIGRFSANASPPTLAFTKSRNATIGSNTIIQDGDNLGQIVFSASDGSDMLSNAAKIEVEVDGTPGADDLPGRIGFYTTGDGGTGSTERMRIDSAGNIGFGITGPTFAAGNGMHFADTFKAGFGTGNGTRPDFQISGDNNGLAIACGTGADTADLLITTAGYVGIGCTPGQLFTVEGSTPQMEFRNTADSFHYLSFVNSANTSSYNDIAAVGAEIDSGNAKGRLSFKTRTSDGSGAQVERMRIHHAGGINIGTNMTQNYDAGKLAIINTTTTNTQYIMNTGLADPQSVFGVERSGSSAYKFFNLYSGRRADNGGGDLEFQLRGDGEAYADGSWTGGGADYAEYFEWSDGNASSQDRIGLSVVLDGNKIREATGSDSADNIIGVISGNPAVVGDAAYTRWADKYEKDEYGRYIMETYTAADGRTKDDKDNTLMRRKLNASYNESLTYVERENRKEWDTVGLMGKLRIKKGQQTGTNWIKMRDISASVEEWLVR